MQHNTEFFTASSANCSCAFVTWKPCFAKSMTAARQAASKENIFQRMTVFVGKRFADGKIHTVAAKHAGETWHEVV